MKGLLLKDFYVLLKQVKLYLVFIVVLSLIPSMNSAGIATVYGAMLPVTAIAFDERSKWNQLAVMMPYSSRDMVLSKYIIGYFAVVFCGMVSLGVQAIIGLVQNNPITPEMMLVIAVTVAAGLILLAINLPFMFWLGVERGRLVFMVLIAATVFIGMSSAESAKVMLQTSTITPTQLLGLSYGAAVIFNLVSIAASSRLYRKKAIS